MGSGYWEGVIAKAASKDLTDVFMTEGYNSARTYQEYLQDISDAPFVDLFIDAAIPCVTLEEKIVGIPVQMSGHGIVYNKEVFNKHGLDIPQTFSELKTISKVLKSSGITPFVNQFKDSWLIGNLVGYGYVYHPDQAKLTLDLTAGKARLADSDVMMKNLEFVDFLLENGQENSTEYGWTEATTAFAQGEGAMIFEGIWI